MEGWITLELAQIAPLEHLDDSRKPCFEQRNGVGQRNLHRREIEWERTSGHAEAHSSRMSCTEPRHLLGQLGDRA
jgi:hypothetical protein